MFFILGDLIKTADELLYLVRDRDRDILIISDLTNDELQQHYTLVQSKLTLQLQRLQRFGDIFISNPTIDLLDTEIKNELEKAIGEKGEGLYSIGAALFFNQMLGSTSKENEPEEDYMESDQLWTAIN